MTHLHLPLISVIIPTCHRNDLLAKCLDCLAPGVQTLPPEQYEVIVTDDGSRSTARAFVQESYPWVRWVAGPRRGPAANRNNGAKFTQGQWLAFTDDDCLPMPGWLEGFAQASATEGVCVLEGKTTCAAGLMSPMYEAPINLKGGLLWSCNLMFRSNIFWEMDGFDSSYSFAMEDIDMRDRLTKTDQKVVFVSDAVVDHPPRRQRGGVRSGEHTEAYVQHWYKMGHSGSYVVPYLKHIKHRLYIIRRFPVSRDYWAAFAALLTEISFVLPRLTRWQRKYRQQYSPHEPALSQALKDS